MRARGDVRNSVPGKRIERDQVELARHVARRARRARAACDGAVVDAVEHHVFERDEVARRALEVAAARGHQLGERMLAVDRHEAVAQRVVRRVQRHGERDRAFVAQAVDPGHEARRRQRDAPARQAVGVVVEEQRAARATTVSKLASGSPMPIITTLVIGARPGLDPRPRRRRRRAACDWRATAGRRSRRW